jgi:hypothetical protein
MRFKIGLLLGFAGGYVMGTKAGRYRYDQIMKVVGQIGQSEPAAKARAQAGRMVEEATQRIRSGSIDGMGTDTAVRAVTLP